jgi:hypothetical protein
MIFPLLGIPFPHTLLLYLTFAHGPEVTSSERPFWVEDK